MSYLDPQDRIDLTGPWTGFGFQRGPIFTLERHDLKVQDTVWWSLPYISATKLAWTSISPLRP